ncbi:MAG: dihydroneopterin aldolase [Saprospiraceae bacterium]|nr:dihydroneopterin aldolase [Saprospiraceae bacterium]
MSTYKIGISGASFYAFHGYYEAEHRMGNQFLVDVELELPSGNFDTESLSSTANYEEIYKLCAEEMGITRRLLETVADSMVNRLLSRWPEILGYRVRIIKEGVQLGGKLSNAFVELHS